MSENLTVNMQIIWMLALEILGFLGYLQVK